jgi:hypothetical protein
MPTWTRVADPAESALLPAGLMTRMIAGRGGSYGLLLATGDVLRVTGITAAHLSSDGPVLLDVRLDHAGVPEGVDTAWWSKHYLGCPVPGRAGAMVNLAHVVAAVEFGTASAVEPVDERTAAAEAGVSTTVEELRQVAEDAAERRSLE